MFLIVYKTLYIDIKQKYDTFSIYGTFYRFAKEHNAYHVPYIKRINNMSFSWTKRMMVPCKVLCLMEMWSYDIKKKKDQQY